MMIGSVRQLFGAGVLGLALLGAGAPGASAAQSPSVAFTSAAAQAYPGESYSQYYRGGRRYGYYGRRRGYGGGALAAGVIGGLAAGALVGGAIANSQPAYGYGGPGTPVGNVYGRDPNFVNYCASRYRSFDPVSGTYLASDGYRYPCQ